MFFLSCVRQHYIRKQDLTWFCTAEGGEWLQQSWWAIMLQDGQTPDSQHIKCTLLLTGEGTLLVIVVVVWFNKTGLASSLYTFLLESSYKRLALQNSWQKHFISFEISVFTNIELASKNPNHQLIYFNVLNRIYLTPKKQHAMNKNTSPFYSFFSPNHIL